MTRFLLDTNIVSYAMKSAPDSRLVAWLSSQRDDELFISSFTVAELRRGVLELPAGKRQRQLEDWFTGPKGPSALFVGRILAFDEPAALIWARLMAAGTKEGKPRSALDTIVAAISEANDCVLVTANEKHFPGVACFNPLRENS